MVATYTTFEIIYPKPRKLGVKTAAFKVDALDEEKQRAF